MRSLLRSLNQYDLHNIYDSVANNTPLQHSSRHSTTHTTTTTIHSTQINVRSKSISASTTAQGTTSQAITSATTASATAALSALSQKTSDGQKYLVYIPKPSVAILLVGNKQKKTALLCRKASESLFQELNLSQATDLKAITHRFGILTLYTRSTYSGPLTDVPDRLQLFSELFSSLQKQTFELLVRVHSPAQKQQSETVSSFLTLELLPSHEQEEISLIISQFQTSLRLSSQQPIPAMPPITSAATPSSTALTSTAHFAHVATTAAAATNSPKFPHRFAIGVGSSATKPFIPADVFSSPHRTNKNAKKSSVLPTISDSSTQLSVPKKETRKTFTRRLSLKDRTALPDSPTLAPYNSFTNVITAHPTNSTLAPASGTLPSTSSIVVSATVTQNVTIATPTPPNAPSSYVPPEPKKPPSIDQNPNTAANTTNTLPAPQNAGNKGNNTNSGCCVIL